MSHVAGRRSRKGRVHFAPGSLADVLASHAEAVIRPAAGVAFVPELTPSVDQSQGASRGAEVLVERIRQELDPRGVLAS